MDFSWLRSYSACDQRGISFTRSLRGDAVGRACDDTTNGHAETGRACGMRVWRCLAGSAVGELGMVDLDSSQS